MAELNISSFMLTTSLSKPVAMDVAKPFESDPPIFADLPASRSMTILLGKNNKVVWYMGESGKNEPKIETFAHIRQAIIANRDKVLAQNGGDPKKSILLIIKPTAGANYKNFVDILDELNVAKINTAPAIDDDHITSEEHDFMARNQL